MAPAADTATDADIPPLGRQHLARLNPYLSLDGLSLLDVGCGSGDFVRLALSEGADAHGLEVDELTIQRAIAAGTDPARLVLGDGATLPFADDSFDVVSFVFSFHHVPPEVHQDMLSEVARVLKPGGHIVAFDPRPAGMMTEIIKLIEDETEVRTVAQALLAKPPAPFEIVATSDYEVSRRFDGFEALLTAIVNVDRKRAERLGETGVREETQRRFETLGQKLPDGGTKLTQPTAFFLLRHA